MRIGKVMLHGHSPKAIPNDNVTFASGRLRYQCTGCGA